MLTADGLVAVGDHVFELFLEDFPRKTITLTYGDGTSVQRDAAAPPLCRVKLQFSIQSESEAAGLIQTGSLQSRSYED